MKFEMQDSRHYSRILRPDQDGKKSSMASMGPSVSNCSINERIPIKSMFKQTLGDTVKNDILNVNQSSDIMSRGENRIDRSALVDKVSSVLPERTRLRRQRHMSSKDSVDPLEDSITRLNRLRAKISGALTEVKGVLKQYSADIEGDEEHTGPNSSIAAAKKMNQEEGPVNFRFVRKIRRRSIFDESNNKNQFDVNEISREIQNDIASLDIVQAQNDSKDNIICTEYKVGSIVQNKKNEILTSKVCESKIEQEEKIYELPENLTVSLDNNYVNIQPEAPIKSCIQQITTLKDHQVQSKDVMDELVLDNKNSSIKSRQLKDNFRRASIAVVEELQNASLIASTQRRPSDSLATDMKKTKIEIKCASIGDVGLFPSSAKVIKKDKLLANKINTVTSANNDIEDMSNSILSITSNEANNNYKDVAPISIAPPTLLSAITKEQSEPMRQLSVSNSTDTTHPVVADGSVTSISAKPTEPIELKKKSSSELYTAEIFTLHPTLERPLVALDLGSQISTIPSRKITHSSNSQPTTDIIQIGSNLHKVCDNYNEKSYPTITDSNFEIAESLQLKTKKNENVNIKNFNGDEKQMNLKEFIEQKQQITAAIVKDKEEIIKECVQDNITKSDSNRSIETISRFKKLDLDIEALPNILSTSEGLTKAKVCVLPRDKHIAASVGSFNLQGKMPELKSLPIPVKPVNIFQAKEEILPSDDREDPGKKKLIFKKIIRKNSVDKRILTKSQEPIIVPANDAVEKVSNTNTAHQEDSSIQSDVTNKEKDQELIVLHKPRKVKKKVIIKRQQRKLSASETFFNDIDDSNKLSSGNVETFEKAITYVTDDEEENNKKCEENIEQKPLKSCLKTREFKVGDWILYGERVKKTQIKWKKGQIKERITSISYKLDIDGKEVSSHISYIKHYTSRKVNFSGKEYLEIDYEQIAQEEQKTRSYSIWNMV